VDVRGIDPRDQTWELARPSYRVYFQDRDGAQDEYEVRGGDVCAVIARAEAKRSARSFVLYVCVAGDGLGLVRLHNSDPNSAVCPIGSR